MFFSGYQAMQASKQAKLSSSAAELSFNLEVMARLQDILFATARDPASHDHVWGPGDVENNPPGVSAQSMLDVLSMALAAVERMPGFSRNRIDWATYTDDVLRASPALVDLMLKHCDYWPEVVPHANKVAAERGLLERCDE